MPTKSLRMSFPAIALLLGANALPAMAQDSYRTAQERREYLMPVRQEIGSDGAQAHNDGDSATPSGSAIVELPHQGRLARSGASALQPESSLGSSAYPNRLVCEHRRSIASTEWRCKPQLPQR